MIPDGEELVRIWRTYPFLSASVLVAGFTGLMASLLRQHRWNTVVAGLLATPAAVLGLWHGDYWNPQTLGGSGVVPEGFLYMFAVGSGSWIGAVVPWSGRFQVEPACLVRPGRYAGFVLAGVFGYLVLRGLGFSSMGSDLAVMAALAAFVLVRQPELWRLAASGFVVFGTVVWFIEWLCFAVWPRFLGAWNPDQMWAQLWLGVPSGEVLFHYLFGAMFPVTVAWYRGSSTRIGPRQP